MSTQLNSLFNNINVKAEINRLKKEYKLSDREIKEIIKSQFHLVVTTIRSRNKKTLKLIHLGKFTPTRKSLNNEKNKELSNTGITNT